MTMVSVFMCVTAKHRLARPENRLSYWHCRVPIGRTFQLLNNTRARVSVPVALTKIATLVHVSGNGCCNRCETICIMSSHGPWQVLFEDGYLTSLACIKEPATVKYLSH
jgi:hypothetical protein